MARLIRTDSDILSLVLRCQYVTECWLTENGYALEGEEIPEPPRLEEREE